MVVSFGRHGRFMVVLWLFYGSFFWTALLFYGRFMVVSFGRHGRFMIVLWSFHDRFYGRFPIGAFSLHGRFRGRFVVVSVGAWSLRGRSVVAAWSFLGGGVVARRWLGSLPGGCFCCGRGCAASNRYRNKVKSIENR